MSELWVERLDSIAYPQDANAAGPSKVLYRTFRAQESGLWGLFCRTQGMGLSQPPEP